MLDYLNLEFLKQWMNLISEELRPIRLLDVIAPGSHNSNSYTLEGGLLNKFAKNQLVDITKQLELGIRHLDLRYGMDKKKKKLVDQHGHIKGGDFENNFIQVRNFLEKYPQEFIVIKIQAEEVITQELKTEFIGFIEKCLGSYLINSEDTNSWFDLKKVTMGDIWKTKKRIFFLYHYYKVFFTNLENVGFFSGKDVFQSHWHDVMKTSLLFESNLDQLDKRAKNEEDFLNKIFVNQFIMTIQRSTGKVAKKILTFDVPTLRNFVMKTLKRNALYFFLFENKDKNFNFLLFDLIHIDVYILLITISLNITSKISLKKCFFEGTDITENVGEFIIRDEFIFIGDVPKFKKIFNKSKNLCFLYEYDNENCGYLKEKLNKEKNIFIFDNPLIKNHFQNLKAFAVFVHNQKKLSFWDIAYEKEQEFKDKVVKIFQDEKFLAGFYVSKDNIFYYNS